MKLSPTQQVALVQSLHSFAGATGRWAGAARLDNEALTARITEEFGIQGGYRGQDCGYDYHGGQNPRITIMVPGEANVELAGRDLLAAVREVFNMGRPGELF